MHDALRMGDHIICRTCADTMSDEARKAAGGGSSVPKDKHATAKTNELKAVDASQQPQLLHCSRCSRWVTAEDRLGAIETLTQLICPTCVETLSPEAKANLLKEADELKKTGTRARHKPKAKGKRPPTHIMKSPLAGKRSGQGAMMMFAVAGIAAGIVAVLFLMGGGSGNRHASSRRNSRHARRTTGAPDAEPGLWEETGAPVGDEPREEPAGAPEAAPVESRAPHEEPTEDTPEEPAEVDLAAELDRLRPGEDAVAGIYGPRRRDLQAFADMHPDAPQAAEAKELIAKLDARYREEAEEALSDSILSARDFAKKGEYEKARQLLATIGKLFDDGEWYEEEGKPQIDEELARIEQRESRIAAPPPQPQEDAKPPVAAPVARPLTAPDAPVHFLRNGSMNDGVDIPDGWTAKVSRGSRVFRDTKDFYGGPAALCVESPGGQAIATRTIEHPALAGRRLGITAHVRTSSKDMNALLIVRAYGDGARSIKEARSPCPEPGGGWKPLSFEIELPEKAKKLDLMFACAGKGKAWLDEARVFDLDRLASADPGEITGNLAPNGSMTQGAELPVGWKTGKKRDGRAYRDTTVFLSGPASLCCESTGGVSAANLRIHGITGPVTVSWHMRTTVKKGTATMLQLHVRDKAGKPLKTMKEIGRVRKPGPWKAFTHQTVIPSNADFISLVFVHTGDGRSWIDDVSIVGGEETVTGTQIIKNGSMSDAAKQGAKHWGKWSNAQIARDTEDFRTAPASMRVDPIAGKSGCAVQQLTGFTGTRFKASVWIKASPEAIGEMKITVYGAPRKYSAYVASKVKHEEWKRYTKEFVVPAGANRFHVELYAHQGGHVWFDDVALYAIGE